MLDQFFRKFLTKRVLHHAIFWFLNLAFVFSAPLIGGREDYWYIPLRGMMVFALLAFPVYFNLLYFIPKYLRTKKYWTYTFWVIISSAIFCFFKVYIKLGILHDPIDEDVWEEISTGFFLPIIYLSVTSFLKFYREWVNFQEVELKLKETENEKLEAELKVLKAQINPHFMFNTLNNIYSLSLDKSNLTPGIVLKLSEILSYTLYECKEDKVLVKDEIAFINNYLELEKIRIGEKADIQFVNTGIYDDLRIAPLLFMPFIENAFKHGINQRPSNPYIKIYLEFSGDKKMRFSIKNNTNPNFTPEKSNANGIGLENAKKRLNLIYPNSHKLTISDSDDLYKVELELDLKKN